MKRVRGVAATPVRGFTARRWLALGLLAVVILLAAGCGGGSVSQEDFDALEARVAVLERNVAKLDAETEAARALSGRLDDLETFLEDARDRLSQLGDLEAFLQEMRDKLSQLGDLNQLLQSLGNLAPS